MAPCLALADSVASVVRMHVTSMHIMHGFTHLAPIANGPPVWSKPPRCCPPCLQSIRLRCNAPDTHLCRELGKQLERGTPTPAVWLTRHGDQRVPVLLTVPRNDVPFRIPPAVLDAMRADLALPQHVPRAAPDAVQESPRTADAAGAAAAVPGPRPRRTLSMRSTRSGIGGLGTKQSSVRSTWSAGSQGDAFPNDA